MENRFLNSVGYDWNESLTKIFNESYGLFVARAMKFVMVSEDAEDVVMEVFLRLLNRPERVQNITAYVLAAVSNQSLDFLKKKRPITVNNVNRLERRTVSEFNVFEEKQRLEYYLSKVDFTPEQKQLWEYIEKEYTNAEIAEILGKTADQVRKERFTLVRKIQRTALRLQ